MRRCAIVAMALLMLIAADSRADIYKWEDETGAIHFTDDLSNIPSGSRGKATMVIREAPRTAEPLPSVPPPPAPAPSPKDEAAEAAMGKEALASQAEQLKAKIAAKEKLIRFVEDRQNLALNPDRRRVIDPGDLELVRKYQAELPEDRQMLQDLESRLELLK
ncbi:MAG: hypothetical protein A2Z40_02000 [Deltaproteobacteria bacterium RBG_19FT_COMBO_60_16]|nr:MAG: hypothetical protein A2Z13_06220 [Deltaproteobacteria bacterium RBG_16_64_85]OGP99700.1 MAG: hypothetical protein A2Z40_02000 [Deltaproteobacteria bacterium RBG_19FT_COMBO_60_16]